MDASKMAVVQSAEQAQVNYRRLITAIIDAGFRISLHSSKNVTSSAMDYNFIPVDVESAFDSSGRHIFTVVYKPVENVFYLTSAKDVSLSFGEIQSVSGSDEKLLDYFERFRDIMFPTTSLYMKKAQELTSPV